MLEWLPVVQDAIDYIERNLLSVKGSVEVAEHVYMSEPYLQKGFQVLTGFSVGEYIRNRKLYEAALEIQDTNNRISSIAQQFGYESQESFTKAFLRFHGISPNSVRKNLLDGNCSIKSFLPISVNMSIKGGEHSGFRVLRKGKLIFVGIKKELPIANLSESLLSFWNEIRRYYNINETSGETLCQGSINDNNLARAIQENSVGEYGIVLERTKTKIVYMIAGRYSGGTIPSGMTAVTFENSLWVVCDKTSLLFSESLESDLEEVCHRIEKYSEYRPLSDNCIDWFEGIDHMWKETISRKTVWIPVCEKDTTDNTQAKKKHKILFLAIVVFILFIGSIGIVHYLTRQKPQKEEVQFGANSGDETKNAERTICRILTEVGLESSEVEFSNGVAQILYYTDGNGDGYTEKDYLKMESFKNALNAEKGLSFRIRISVCSQSGKVLHSEEWTLESE